jgi:MFS family permease
LSRPHPCAGAESGDPSEGTGGAESGTPALPRGGHPTPVVVAVGFALLGLSYVINAMDRQVFYPLLPEIRADLGFSLAQGGLLATGFTLGMAVAGVPAGYLVDRLPRKHVLLASIFLYSIGTLLTPLASGFADMAAYRLLSGLGEGVQSAALSVTVASYFYLHRSFAIGALGAAFGLGTFLGPIVGTTVALDFGSWRAPFVAFGCSGLAIIVLIAVGVRRRLTESLAGSRGNAELRFDHLPEHPYNRNTIALAVATASTGLVFYGFLGLYPTYLRTELHYSAGQAAVATSVVGVGSAFSLLWGWLGDRFNQRTLLTITYLSATVASLLLFNGPAARWWQYVFAFVLGTSISGSAFTNCNSAMQRSVRPHQVGRAAGLFVASYYSAAAISGFVFAELVDALGWHYAAFWQLSALPLVAVAALRVVDPKKIMTSGRRR